MEKRRRKTRNKLPHTWPNKPVGSFIGKATKLDGMHPHDFLLAVMRCKHVQINGVKHLPTFEQRMSAAEHLIAALQGRAIPEKDDHFYQREEKGKP